MTYADPSLSPLNPILKHALGFFEAAGLTLSSPPMKESESAAYAAHRLTLNTHTILFRNAKTTPGKLGQFVTLWKRLDVNSPIAPFDINDGIDFVVVCVKNESQDGIFIFDAKTLCSKNIFSIKEQGGKRAFRVYSPWSHPLAKQALATQKWQLNYFVNLNQEPSSLHKDILKRFEK